MALMAAALTGGVAEGKTTVLRMLSEFGLLTASADEMAREALASPETQAEVAALFGIRAPLDRSQLRTIVANDPDKRRSLNSVLHPEVFARMVESGADVIEVPLLLEACLQSSFERVWVATCGPEEQLRRLTERLGAPGRAREMVGLQLPTEVKLAFADRTIRTDRPLDAVQQAAGELARSLGSR
jgi:dephospho-CoA kinase